jgi:Cdc6-like AAA superfamily ATPase
MSEVHAPISSPKILIEGAPGTGKTYSIGTLVDWAEANKKEVFVIFAENGLPSLLNYWLDKGKTVPECLHYHACLTRPLSLEQLLKSADNTGKLTYETLIKMQDPDRSKHNSFFKILETCANFKDDRTGKEYGSFTTWGTDKILVIDSLTTLCNAAMKMVTGAKLPGMNEYGQAQGHIMNFLGLLTDGCEVPVVLIAHVSRETDEVSGSVKLMTLAVGKAISGQIPRFFPDVIYTVKDGANFFWDTAAYGVDTKATNLPIASKQKPDFAIIFDKWIKRGAA